MLGGRPIVSFGNVRRNRDDRSPKLRNNAAASTRGNEVANVQDFDAELHPFLPRNQTTIPSLRRTLPLHRLTLTTEPDDYTTIPPHQSRLFRNFVVTKGCLRVVALPMLPPPNPVRTQSGEWP